VSESNDDNLIYGVSFRELLSSRIRRSVCYRITVGYSIDAFHYGGKLVGA